MCRECICARSCHSGSLTVLLMLPGQWHFTHILNHCNLCTHSLHWHNMYVVFCAVYRVLLQYSKLPQTLVHKFGVAAMKGVARNKNITEFQLEPYTQDQQVVNGILEQLTAVERRNFRVGRNWFDPPTIERCPVGEWWIVSLLMQCLCCVGQVLSHLYQRSSLSFPNWLCCLGGRALSCVSLLTWLPWTAVLSYLHEWPVQHPMYMYQPLHCWLNAAVQAVEVQ